MIIESIIIKQVTDMSAVLAKVTHEEIEELTNSDWPEWATCQATDENGQTWFYENKPKDCGDHWWPNQGRKEQVQVICTNWKESLVMRKP